VSIGGFPVQFMTYFAPAGEVNDVGVLNGSGGTLVFREFGSVPLTAGSGCTQIDPQRASCPTVGIAHVGIDTSDGSDRVRLGASHGLGDLPPACCGVIGGAGADTLDAHFLTGTGSPTLSGEAGKDTLLGGARNDLLRGGAGADAMTGGDGFDTATYDDHTAAVTATLDGIANDGSPGVDGGFGTLGDDSIGTDIEAIDGGSGDDSLTGDNQKNTLVGGLGRDILSGKGAADVIAADDGIRDKVLCGNGVDTADVDIRDRPLGFPDCETVN
jgi:Ca2+-binding RTX toxin-like protein